MIGRRHVTAYDWMVTSDVSLAPLPEPPSDHRSTVANDSQRWLTTVNGGGQWWPATVNDGWRRSTMVEHHEPPPNNHQNSGLAGSGRDLVSGRVATRTTLIVPRELGSKPVLLIVSEWSCRVHIRMVHKETIVDRRWPPLTATIDRRWPLLSGGLMAALVTAPVTCYWRPSNRRPSRGGGQSYVAGPGTRCQVAEAAVRLGSLGTRLSDND
nr:hypothetical protein [Tanacetum cinerariifolium]